MAMLGLSFSTLSLPEKNQSLYFQFSPQRGRVFLNTHLRGSNFMTSGWIVRICLKLA